MVCGPCLSQDDRAMSHRVGFSVQIGLGAVRHCSVVVKFADSGARQDLHPTLSLTSFVT